MGKWFVASACSCLIVSAHVLANQSEPRPVRFFVLDINGDGIKLTSAADGVLFDVDSTGKPVRTGWTSAGADDAFVIVAPDVRGPLNGEKLLGTGMRLPDGRRLVNPDRALLFAQGMDLDENLRVVGGLQGRLPTFGPEDAPYATVRVWTDKNHNGRAESAELSTMEVAGIDRINSMFKVESKADEHGNILSPRGNFATRVKGLEVWRDVHVVQFVR
jgi:hypothetical protein